MDNETFQLVRVNFEVNEGYFPGIELAGMSGAEVQSIYDLVRAGSKVSSIDSSVWDIQLQTAVALNEAKNPAGLVATNQVAPFHFCVEGLTVDGTELPELGVFIFADSIEFNWRCGEQWTQRAIGVFFEMLNACVRIAPTAFLRIPNVEPPIEPDKILKAWQKLDRRETAKAGVGRLRHDQN